mgnify:FL=1
MEWKYLNPHTAFDYLYYIMLGKRCQQYPVRQSIFRKYGTKFRSGKGRFFGQNRNEKEYNFLTILFFMNKLRIAK